MAKVETVLDRGCGAACAPCLLRFVCARETSSVRKRVFFFFFFYVLNNCFICLVVSLCALMAAECDTVARAGNCYFLLIGN